jgi:GNAT superfamily N-acetyltransferase
VIERLSRDELLGHRALVVRMYREVYADPPWNETEEELAGYGPRFDRCVLREGFESVVSRDGGSMVGLGYGWRTPERFPDDHPFYAAVVEGLGADVVNDVILATDLEVAELFVTKDHRRRGIGRALLRSLVDGRSAWLSTLAGSPAATMYASLGWTAVGTVRPAHMRYPLTAFVVFVVSRMEAEELQ